MPNSLKLDRLPDAATILVDSNILIYHFTRSSKLCREFLRRVARGAVRAIVSVEILLEVAHRLMILEARERGLVRGGHPARRLAERPDLVRRLDRYPPQVLCIPDMGIEVEPTNWDDVRESLAVRASAGLMTLDALSVAFMRRREIRCVATADRSFTAVPDLVVYSPADVGHD